MTIFERTLSDREVKTNAYFAKKKRKPRREQKQPLVDYDDQVMSIWTQHYRDYINGVTISAFSGGELVPVSSRYSSGTVTPDFKAKKKLHNLPMNDYSLIVRKAENVASSYFNGHASSGFESISTMDARRRDSFWPVDYGDLVTELADQRATRRIAGKASLASVNLGIMFAERKKTARLIQSSATRLYLAMRALKKGNLGELYATLGIDTRRPSPREYEKLLRTPPDKRLANHWLEYNFGWVPLLKEIDGACELLAKHAVERGDHGKIAASARVGTSKALLRSNGYPFNGVLTNEVRVRYTLRCRLDNDARNALAETGITDPLSVAWEILPFSFVADWFIPVSGYLKRLQAFDGFEFVNGTRSRLWKGKVSKNFSWFTPGSSGSYETSSGSSVFEETRYNRGVLGTFPSQIPPSFRNPLEDEDIWKPLTSIALMSQLLRSSSPVLRQQQPTVNEDALRDVGRELRKIPKRKR